MTVNVDYFFIWKQRQLHFRRFTTQKSAHSRRTVKVIVAIAYKRKGPLQQMRKGSVQPSSEKY